MHIKDPKTNYRTRWAGSIMFDNTTRTVDVSQ